MHWRYRIRYHVDDSTDIRHIHLKQFLSHIDTKAELTNYLAEASLQYYSQNTDTDFVVVSGTAAQSNHERLSENLIQHNQEEADTIIILHAIDVS